MDENDEVESGLAASLAGGFKGKGADPDGSVSASAEGELRGGTLLKADDGQLKAQDCGQASLSLTLGAGPFEIKGDLVTSTRDGSWHSTKVEISGERSCSWEDLSLMLGSAHTVSGLFGDLAQVIQRRSGILDDSAAVKAGSIADLIVDNSTLGHGTHWGTKEALKNIESFEGVEVGHKLSVSVEDDADEGKSIELKLERTSSATIGDKHAVGAYAEIEGAQEVFSVSATC